MFKKTLLTAPSYAILVARIFLGLLIARHGAQKFFGWFGGAGWENTVKYFVEGLHLPYLILVLVALFEFGGGLLLVLGLISRYAALMVFCVIAGALIKVHIPQGDNIELHLLYMGLIITVFIHGGGSYSLDRKLFNK